MLYCTYIFKNISFLAVLQLFRENLIKLDLLQRPLKYLKPFPTEF